LISKQHIISATRRRAGNIGLPILALCLVSFFWGTTWLATKKGVTAMPAFQMAGLRLVIAGVLYLIFFLYKKAPLPKGRQWWPVLVLAFLNFVLSNGLVALGLKYISSGLGAIIGAVFPLWVVIFSAIKGEKIPWLAVAGMVLGFGGVCIVFYDHLHEFGNADFQLGIILSMAGGICWAFGTMYTQKKAASYNPYFSLGLQMLISGLVLSGVAQVQGNTISYTAIPANAWWAILYLVIIGSVLTFAAYIYTLQHLPIALASVYAYINPIVAVLLGAFILHEPLNTYIAVGGAVTIAGVYIVNYAMRNTRKNAAPPAEV
jgi:drug/metabolite transporter (DMT)-like permease